MEKRLANLLVQSGAARMEDVSAALQAQAGGDSRKLAVILLSERRVEPGGLAKALGALHEVPFTELGQLDPAGCALLTADYLAEIRMVPFRLEKEEAGERIHLAVEDPSDFVLIDELRYLLRRSVSVYVAPSDQIDGAIDRIRRGLVQAANAGAEAAPVEVELDDEAPLVGELIEEDEAERSAEAPRPSAGADPLAMSQSEWEVGPATTSAANVLRDVKPVNAVFDAAAGEALNAGAAPPAGGAEEGPKAEPVPLARTPTGEIPAAAPSSAIAAGVTDVSAAAVGAVSAAAVSAVSAAASAASAPAGEVATTPVPVQQGAEPSPGKAPSDSKEAHGSTPAPTPPIAAPEPSPVPEADPSRLDFSEADLAVLDTLERLAGGDESAGQMEKVKPARMVAALTRLLMKKGIIDEHEFLDELSRK